MQKFLLLFVLLFSILPALSAQTQKPKKEKGKAEVKKEEKKPFYDVDRIVEVRVQFTDPQWSRILDSLKSTGAEGRLAGSVTIDGTRFDKVGIRYKGNSSFYSVRKGGLDKLPLNIELNYEDRTQRLEGGIRTLKLTNVFRDPSFTREVLAYEIARQYLPAPRANFARVYVNDRYLGVYNSAESVDSLFVANHYGTPAGALFKCEPVWEDEVSKGCEKGDHSSLQYLGEDTTCYTGLYEMKSRRGWGGLVELAKALAKGQPELEKVLDIDQVLWMLAFDNVLVNLDSYIGLLCHNYYLYQDTSGVFHPILWDMNLAFGGFRHTGEEGNPALNNRQLQELSPLLHARNERRPLIMSLLANSLYRKMYIAHMRTIMQEQFVNGRYLERAKQIRQMITPLVKADERKLYSFDNFQSNLEKTVKIDGGEIIGITELMGKRIDYLKNHPLFSPEAPRLTSVKHRTEGKEIRIEAQAQGAEKCWLFYRFGTTGPVRRIAMSGPTGGNVQAAKDASPAVGEGPMWTASIEHRPGARYFVVAEGDKAAAVYPERSSKEMVLAGQ